MLKTQYALRTRPAISFVIRENNKNNNINPDVSLKSVSRRVTAEL